MPLNFEGEAVIRRPNILMILTDDHAAHAIGAYGSLVNTTPNLDRIAAEGALVENAFCTNALCTPSRAAILTGTYSHVSGVTTLDTPLDNTQETFVSELKAAGYHTGIVGKWHLGEGEAHDPRGFDYWEVLRDQGEYFDPTLLSATGERTAPGYVTDVLTDLSLEWIRSLPEDEPWCLLLHHKAPHRWWIPDHKHVGMYTDPIPVPATFTDDYSTRTDASRRAAMRVADHLTKRDLKVDPPPGLTGDDLALWKYQRYMEDYLRCVASVDDNVGRVLDFLDEVGQADDTLVAYSSDQGFFLGDHGWFDKRFMYDESIRMPLLVKYPAQIPAGTNVAQILTNVDFAQTFLDFAGVPAPVRMQGVSFAPALRGQPQHTRDGFYYRYYENDDAQHHATAHYGIRTDRHKLIYFYGDGLGLPGTSDVKFTPAWELYDLEADPDELNNVYDDPAYAHVRADLTVQLAQLQASLGDTPYVATAS